MNDYGNIDVERIVQNIVEKLHKEYKSLKKLNIMILGKSGVGKSTLLNSLFGEEIVETGMGLPITNSIQKIEKSDFPLAIYDTPGLELKGGNSIDGLVEEIKCTMNKGIDNDNLDEAIHCILYCINVSSNRIEDTEIDFIQKFSNETMPYNVPVIVVLTQAYNKSKGNVMKEKVENMNLSVESVVPVLAQDEVFSEGHIEKAYGLDTLVNVISKILPETVQKTFISIQRPCIELKKKKASAIVAGAAATAFAEGAAPIPFSDAALLVPTETAMLVAITTTFHLKFEKAVLVAIVSSTIGTGGATILGKTVVTNILKFVPGANIVAGAISGSTAAVITFSLGEVYIELLTKMCKGEINLSSLETEEGKAELQKMFKERLKVKRNKKGEPI